MTQRKCYCYAKHICSGAWSILEWDSRIERDMFVRQNSIDLPFGYAAYQAYKISAMELRRKQSNHDYMNNFENPCKILKFSDLMLHANLWLEAQDEHSGMILASLGY